MTKQVTLTETEQIYLFRLVSKDIDDFEKLVSYTRSIFTSTALDELSDKLDPYKEETNEEK